MTSDQIAQELVEAGLHEESVERVVDHYAKMRTHLVRGNYVEAGSHVGNFCENVVNILRDQMGEGVKDHVKVDTFVNQCVSGNIGDEEPKEVRLTIPRVLRGAYELRNSRDSALFRRSKPRCSAPGNLVSSS